jgi:hypothetical protein
MILDTAINANFFNLSFFCFECYDFSMRKKDEERTAAQIAKTLTMMCVRNTFLEKLHEGITPVKKQAIIPM